MNETQPVCPACRAELPSAFPGASIACACGHRVDLPARPRLSAPSSLGEGGPYRSASPSNEPALTTVCPFCGNECPPLVRICPHCDVRLENVRCQRCFSLQAPGAFACGRCRHSLELEPLLDASDAPCPRCNHPLEAAPGSDTRIHECPRCGGIFVPREVLAEILCSAEIGGALREAPSRRARERGGSSVDGAPSAVPGLEQVRYIPCPLCHASMNRLNFGKVSGVIVDVCKPHGTWFDAGELTRVVAFASAGGLERTRERERLERGDEQKLKQRDADVHMQLAVLEARAEPRLEMWRELLGTLFSW